MEIDVLDKYPLPWKVVVSESDDDDPDSDIPDLIDIIASNRKSVMCGFYWRPDHGAEMNAIFNFLVSLANERYSRGI